MEMARQISRTWHAQVHQVRHSTHIIFAVVVVLHSQTAIIYYENTSIAQLVIAWVLLWSRSSRT